MNTDSETMAQLTSYAEVVFTICILSIVITAPLGAIIITITGPRLLSKTSKPPVLEGKLITFFYLLEKYKHVYFKMEIKRVMYFHRTLFEYK